MGLNMNNIISFEDKKKSKQAVENKKNCNSIMSATEVMMDELEACYNVIKPDLDFGVFMAKVHFNMMHDIMARLSEEETDEYIDGIIDYLEKYGYV
jgi:hypothetical protein